MSTPWGYHLILDCKFCDIDKISDESNIKNAIDELIKKTNMIPLGDSHLYRVEPTEITIRDGIDGISAVQIIMTSSIVMHFIESRREAYIDFFSCKAFDNDVVKKIVEDFFGPKKMKYQYILRKA